MKRSVRLISAGATVTLLALAVVATVAGDPLFPEPRFAPEKERLIAADEEAWRIARLSPGPTTEGYCPPPTPEHTATPIPPFLDQSGYSVLGINHIKSRWYDFLDGEAYLVITGASNLDPSAGHIFVYKNVDDYSRRPDQGGIALPSGTGAIRIESVADFVFQLSSESGQAFVFDLRTFTITQAGGTPVPATTVYPVVTIQQEPTSSATKPPCRRTVTPHAGTETPVLSDTPVPSSSPPAETNGTFAIVAPLQPQELSAPFDVLIALTQFTAAPDNYAGYNVRLQLPSFVSVVSVTRGPNAICNPAGFWNNPPTSPDVRTGCFGQDASATGNDATIRLTCTSEGTGQLHLRGVAEAGGTGTALFDTNAAPIATTLVDATIVCGSGVSTPIPAP